LDLELREACEAEELFDLDELERYADEQQEKEEKKK
jgi:hypothetical protein